MGRPGHCAAGTRLLRACRWRPCKTPNAHRSGSTERFHIVRTCEGSLRHVGLGSPTRRSYWPIKDYSALGELWQMRITSLFFQLERKNLLDPLTAFLFANCIYESLSLSRQGCKRFPNDESFSEQLKQVDGQWTLKSTQAVTIGGIETRERQQAELIKNAMGAGNVSVRPYP